MYDRRKWTIHTEFKNVKYIRNLLDSVLGYIGYTLIPCQGAWHGKREKALKIEVIHDKDVSYLITHIAESIKRFNRQDAVLVTSHSIESDLIV